MRLIENLRLIGNLNCSRGLWCILLVLCNSYVHCIRYLLLSICTTSAPLDLTHRCCYELSAEKPTWEVVRWLSSCGNGAVEGLEECDDGDPNDGNGCSSTCKVEPGWECSGSPSVCRKKGDPTPTPGPTPSPSPGPTPSPQPSDDKGGCAERRAPPVAVCCVAGLRRQSPCIAWLAKLI